MSKPARVIGAVLTFACFLLWYITATDYGDSAAIGTYHFERAGETSTLVLNPDHTFRQTRSLAKREQQAQGTWRRVGEGGIVFSKEFLVVSGDEPEPDGTTFSDMQKAFGLFTSLRLRQYHFVWYGKTDSDTSLAGTYTGDEPEVTATLVLKADHSFNQTLEHGGSANRANGTWSQDSDGTIRFSNDFLKTSGEPVGPNEPASAISPNGTDLQVEISMSGQVTEPVFRKR